MQADPQTPFSVACCKYLVCAIAWMVPAAQRDDWRREWLAEIWHRWQFLLHEGEWNGRESLRLIRNCSGAFADAAWHFVAQEGVQSRLREWPRSPWTCLGILTGLLLIVAAVTSGFPATRQVMASLSHPGSGELLFVWLHPSIGGGDRGLPPDVVSAWAAHSHLLESVAAFSVRHQRVLVPGRTASNQTVVATEPALFHVLDARPALGAFPGASFSQSHQSAVVLDYATWMELFHGNSKVIGSRIQVGEETYRVAAVLPATFHFLTRKRSIYLMPRYDSRVMVVARARPGVMLDKVDHELTRIAENACYYFFGGQLRLKFLNSAVLTPLESFALAVFVSTMLSLMVWRVRIRHVQLALSAAHRKATAKRAAFFAAKTGLALVLVFTAGLEWSRSESSVLFGSQDPASGPFLVWLYVLGAMGVFSWSLADQRARCRVCLRLLCFPVRIGCPGCLLLDWSGTELLCTEGHGVLHVPHLAPSWDEESEHWISLDESWRGLFAHTK